MITVVTGAIDSGKTRYLKQLYDKDIRGDGILSLKHFENGECLGYDLYHLKTGRQIPFIRLKEHCPASWEGKHEIGKYVLSQTGFDFAGEILNNIEAGPIYIDEIGPLEIMEKKGFYRILKALIAQDKDLFLSLRSSLIDNFHKEFELHGKTHIITLK